MKKLLAIALVGALTCSMAACGGEPKLETAVCTLEMEEVGVTYEMTFQAENDIVKELTQLTTVELAMFPEEQVALLEESIEEYQKVYDEIEGVEYSAEITEKYMYETITIDMTNEDTLEILRESELLPIEGDANKVSLKKTMDNLESLDWKVELKED